MFWYGGLMRRPLAALLAAGMALAICCAVLWSSQPASSAERANSLRTSALGGLPNILNWLRVHELPVFDPAGRQSVLQMPVGHTTTFGASSVDASAEVADDGSITDSNNLARLQALINKLEAAAPVPQRIPELVPVPIVKALSQAEVMVIKSDLPDSEDVLIVFDEAEASVERALRRLTPTPSPSPDVGSGDVGSGELRESLLYDFMDSGSGSLVAESPLAPPTPPRTPGTTTKMVTGTQVVITFKVTGDVSDFDQDAQAAIKARLQAHFSCYPPDCYATLHLTAASVNLEFEMVSTAPDASALTGKAEAMGNESLDSLSAMLGRTVEEGPEVAVTHGVTVVVSLPAPSPPPPLPPQPALSPPPVAAPAVKRSDDKITDEEEDSILLGASGSMQLVKIAHVDCMCSGRLRNHATW